MYQSVLLSQSHNDLGMTEKFEMKLHNERVVFWMKVRIIKLQKQLNESNVGDQKFM